MGALSVISRNNIFSILTNNARAYQQVLPTKIRLGWKYLKNSNSLTPYTLFQILSEKVLYHWTHGLVL
jgi:hypothetical protein